MATQTMVKIVATGKEGMLLPGSFPFIYDVQLEDELVEGVMSEDLEILESIEFSIEEDPKKCGIGTDKCCIYAVVSSQFECARCNIQLRGAIEAKFASGTMAANYRPAKPYPECRNSR